MTYPILAARDSGVVDEVYVSTDDPEIKTVAGKHGAVVIDRPPHLCTKEALGEDAYVHAFETISAQKGKDPELLVLLFCNAATVLPEHIAKGVELLRKDPKLDSAVTVSRYNMWSPLRARKLDQNGRLKPFVPFETFGDPRTLNCDRDSQGDVLFADMGVSVIRPRNLRNLEHGLLPQKWMGQNIAPIFNEAGCDIDYEWQVPAVEGWIKRFRPELAKR